MEGDFYKCEEVAFRSEFHQVGPWVCLLVSLLVHAKWNFFLSGGQMALPVINPGICEHDIYYIMIFFVCQKGMHRVLFLDRLKLSSTFKRCIKQ